MPIYVPNNRIYSLKSVSLSPGIYIMQGKVTMANSTELNDGYIQIWLGTDSILLSSYAGTWYQNSIVCLYKIEQTTNAELKIFIYGGRESYKLDEARIRYIKIK